MSHFLPSSSFDELPDASEINLAQLDVSDPRLYQRGVWGDYFKRLRDEDPVHYIQDSPFGPFWSVTRFEDIVKVDSDHETFSSEPMVVIGDSAEDFPVEAFITMDEPRHGLQRAAVQPAVAPKNLMQLEALIRSRAAAVLDELPVNQTFDWVEKVSVNLTTQMLATLFAFPFDERHKLTYWSDLVVGNPEMAGGNIPDEERREGLMECMSTFMQLWHARRAEREAGAPLSYDLISLLQSNEHTSDMIDRPMEFLGNIMLLILGGNDTTRNSLTGGVLMLNQFPGEYDKLRANHQLIPNMVSEIIRFQTPLSHMRRTATRDTELGGKKIKAGDKVVMWYISGNRDERMIDNPDQFVIDRKNARRHLSFGFGIHRCMGNRLGEMQLRIVWEEIMKRFEKIEVVGSPVRTHSNMVNGYDELKVRVIPYCR